MVSSLARRLVRVQARMAAVREEPQPLVRVYELELGGGQVLVQELVSWVYRDGRYAGLTKREYYTGAQPAPSGDAAAAPRSTDG